MGMLRAVGGMMKTMLTPALKLERFARSHEFPALAVPGLSLDSAKWLASHAAGPGLRFEQPLVTPMAQ